MKVNLLVICSDFPYPPNHGGRYDMFHRMEAFKDMGFEVDAIFTVNEVPPMEDVVRLKHIVNKFCVIKRERGVKQIFRLIPFQVASRCIKDAEAVRDFAGRKYDVVWLEDFYVWDIYKFLSSNMEVVAGSVVVRQHNDNYVYFKELSKASHSLHKKVIFLLEALKFRFLENKILSEERPIVLSISYDEFMRLKKRYDRVCWLPPAVDLSKVREFRRGEKERVIFVGSLFMDNNVQGIRWFITKVHPVLLSTLKDYELVVAGNTKGKGNPIADLIARYPKISFFDSPRDLSSIYAGGGVFVNPVVHGAGVKNKNIDAILNGLPVVSTPKGNEGTNLVHGVHILVANNREQFSKYVLLLFADKGVREKLVNEAQSFIKKEYNHKEKLKVIFETLIYPSLRM